MKIDAELMFEMLSANQKKELRGKIMGKLVEAVEKTEFTISDVDVMKYFNFDDFLYDSEALQWFDEQLKLQFKKSLKKFKLTVGCNDA